MLNIYKASAGSGKTYKLAYEYIRALLGIKPQGEDKYRLNHPKYSSRLGDTVNRHRYILAITFTNKATEEMKRRIVKELDALSVSPSSGGKDANYAADLCREYGCTRDELAEVAANALRQLLHDYSSFSVTTIDSFFQKVLRTFARELDHQGDFSIELNDFVAVQTAVNDMLDDYNGDSASHAALGAWIYDYMYRQLESGAKSNFFNRKSMLHNKLVSLVSRICDERFKQYSEQMRAYLKDTEHLAALKKQLAARQRALLETVKERSLSGLSLLDSHNAGLDKVSSGSKVIRLFRDNFTAGNPVTASDMFASPDKDTIAKIIGGDSKLYPKKSKVSDADVAYMVSLISDIRGIYAEYFILDDIIDSVDQLTLLAHAWSYLDSLITQNNIVLLSETNHMLSRVIGNDETPFIYERMGVQYRHFLIDEFQDTSRLQWQNLKPLVANGLGSQFDSLIIGDEKQSIYRFRNSDSTLLHTQVAEVDFPYPRYDTHIHGSGEGENTNYRSAADVVRFNNTLFLYLSKILNVEGFENVVQNIPKGHLDLGGYVKFTPVNVNSDDGDSVSDSESKSAQTDQVLAMMADEMRRQHNEGGYPWSDIAVLVATNIEAAKVVDYVLTNCPDIPIISDEALYVRKSPAVQLIIGTLKVLADYRPSGHPDDDDGKYHYPSPSELAVIISRFAYYYDKGVDIDHALNYAIDQSTAPDDLTLDSSIASIRERKPASLIALVETIIHQLIPRDDRSAQISYLNAFQDYVIEYCTYNNQSIRGLLNHWETAKGQLTVSSSTDVDAVKVMTIHKSKGLEFDCVHIPFGSWELIGKPRGGWMPFPVISGIERDACPPAVYVTMSKRYYGEPGTYFYDSFVSDEHDRLVDTMNKTYVAYTRAGRELIVYYNPAFGIGQNISEVFEAAPADEPSDTRLCSLRQAYDPQTMILALGAPTHKGGNAAHGDDSAASKTMDISDYDTYYHSGANILTQVEDMLDADGDAADTADATQTDKYERDTEARDRGIRLHEMLSLIESIDDIDRAVSQVALKRRLPLAERGDDRAFLRRMLNTDDALVYRWYVDYDAAYTEQPIYLPVGSPYRKAAADDGATDDYRRPDRIVVNNDGTVDVIDYKFTYDASSSHRRQVMEYVSILRDMGYDTVRGYVWYPFVDKIIQIV